MARKLVIEHGKVHVVDRGASFGDDPMRYAHPEEMIAALVELIIDMQERITALEKRIDR